MSLKGLFIGIDRFATPKIPWLNCATRDARALYALFTDTLGGDNTLLVDEQATKAAIETAIKEFSTCSPDDIVVISFSGHGSDTNELVAYDTLLETLSVSGISLSDLSEWLHRIPAKQLICILDCCYSGAVGAKAVQAPNRKRALDSTEALIGQMAGEGRVILSACRANESAWEASRFGHGLLTYHLLQTLQSAAHAAPDGRMSIYTLLQQVTSRVMDDSLSIGEIQHPVLVGTIDGQIQWPVFIRGKMYQALFPEMHAQKVEASIDSLLAHGFPAVVVDQWKQSIPTLNQLQLDAINELGLFEGHHLLVSAPTSSGKTMIGELAAVRSALQRKKSIFLFPLKALVNDKYKQFQLLYGDFGIKTIKATGESTSDDILPLMKGQYDVCLMTYEKFSAMVMGYPHLIRQVSVVVVDEVQMITDKNRGVNLEFLLTLLKMRRRQGVVPQIIALSAVIGHTHGFEHWLEAGFLKKTERPVPLDEGIIRYDGSFRYITSDTKEEKIIPHFIERIFRKGSSQDLIIPLVKKLVGEGKKVIVFRATRGDAAGCANYLAENLGLGAVQGALAALPLTDPSSTSHKLKKALTKGVAFHISDLDVDERLLVEQAFRDLSSGLQVIAATTTLAMGINTPAEAVIVAGLEHPLHVPYTIAEYKNIVGRAGRLGYANRGVSFVVAMSAHDENYFWNRYILGTPEDIESRFLSDAADPRTLIVRVLASGFAAGGMSGDDICLFLENSFGSFQQKRRYDQWKWDQTTFSRALMELRTHQLIDEQSGLYHLTPLGQLAGTSGLEIGSIFEVVSALQLMTASNVNELNLMALSQLTRELEDVYFPINKKSTQSEPRAWFGELQRQGVSPAIINAMRGSTLGEAASGTLRAKKTVAAILWVSSMPLSQIEQQLTKYSLGDGAAGAVRSVTARMSDVLPAIGQIAELHFPGLQLNERLSRLLVRLELGLSAELTQIGFYLGKTLTRGDYFRLADAGLSTMPALADATEETLMKLMDENVSKLAAIQQGVKQYQLAQEQGEAPGDLLPIFRI